MRFLEGDPDRPLVAGAVYNGTNTTPYALPDEKTKSTRKSASSLGSNGFNEVRVEDSAGEEEVFTHSQKDEDLLTENATDLTRLPWVGHRSRSWEPEPLRWIGINGALKLMASADGREIRTKRPTKRGELIKSLIGI